MKCLIAETGNRASGSHELDRTAYSKLNWVRFCSWQKNYEETSADKSWKSLLRTNKFLIGEKLRIWVQTSKQLSRRCDADGVFALSAVGALVVRERFKFERKKRFQVQRRLIEDYGMNETRNLNTCTWISRWKNFSSFEFSILNFRSYAKAPDGLVCTFYLNSWG